MKYSFEKNVKMIIPYGFQVKYREPITIVPFFGIILFRLLLTYKPRYQLVFIKRIYVNFCKMVRIQNASSDKDFEPENI